jgi:hypothetical protein
MSMAREIADTMIREFPDADVDVICMHPADCAILGYDHSLSQSLRMKRGKPTFMHVPIRVSPHYARLSFAIGRRCECCAVPDPDFTAVCNVTFDNHTGRCTACKGTGYNIVYRSEGWKDE